jgi:hypothetical protein
VSVETANAAIDYLDKLWTNGHGSDLIHSDFTMAEAVEDVLHNFVCNTKGRCDCTITLKEIT